MNIRRILGAGALAAAAVAAFAGPAGASVTYHAAPLVTTHKPFVVIVNGNVDVTLQPLFVGEVVYHAGVAYTVVNVNGHTVRFSPALTGPSGTVYQFST